MPPIMFYWDPTYLIVLPALIFTVWAQINVNSTFNKYKKVYTDSHTSGYDAARKILDANGLYDVSIETVAGELTDHYDPRDNVIRLSQGVYSSTSAAAVGVAAHEAGHAVQHAKGYFPIKVRQAIIPVTRIGSALAMPLFIIGLFAALEPLMFAGIIFYSLAVVFQLVTLPVEFNASRRAMAALREDGRMDKEELTASRKVLTAAALTYVAALASSLLTLLRLVILAGNRRD